MFLLENVKFAVLTVKIVLPYLVNVLLVIKVLIYLDKNVLLNVPLDLMEEVESV